MNKEELKRTLKKLFGNTGAIIGFVLLGFFIVIAIIAPYIAPPDIPQDMDLERANELIENYEPSNREEILARFDSFQEFNLGFYMQDYPLVKDVYESLQEYDKGNISLEEAKSSLQRLTDAYIVDISLLTQIEEDPGAVLKNIKNVYEKYKEYYERGIEVRNELDELSSLEGNNFLRKAKSMYNDFHDFYIESIDYNPYVMPKESLQNAPQPPSKEYPFGLSNGRDIYYGVVWGTRTAFQIGFSVVAFATFVGLLVGSIAAYFGGWVDEILMRITDIFLSIPFILSAMVLTTVLGTGIDKVMIAMMTFTWMSTARLIRGNILQAKNEQYVLAARALGVPDWKIIIVHILPNTIFPVIIQATMRIGTMVITASGLSFLGLGAPQGYADWGSILSFARNWMLGGGDTAFQYWYTIVFPGTAMVLFVLGWNLVGDALRDIFDPKNRM
ncbi:ABC transporter permease [Geotoga petraea]|uniref:ABC transporter permease n=1 Tax=Geotoga petraea TaxID=28234 RepID=A0A4Z0W5K1_9BACT|nr:ABC transporter permease [Geotoga petraea]TGG89140.1 ABC transporter permease [Geotoga petraea]